MIRPIEQNDAESCGKIGYEAHKAISSTHGYPSEQPSEESGIGLIRRLLGNPNSSGVLAERQGKILGSIFLHRFPPSLNIEQYAVFPEVSDHSFSSLFLTSVA